MSEDDREQVYEFFSFLIREQYTAGLRGPHSLFMGLAVCGLMLELWYIHKQQTQ